MGSGMDSGVDSRTDSGVDSGLHSGVNNGVNSGVDSEADSDLGLGMTGRVDPVVNSAVNPGMDSEVTLKRLRNALGSTLRWTRNVYDSENAIFLDKITVAVKNNTSFLD